MNYKTCHRPLVIFTLLASFTMLTGCVDSQWLKAGASDQDRAHQLTSCEAQALKDLPPDNVAEEKYTASTEKQKGDKKAQSDTRTDYRVRDENEGPRETMVKDCMYRHGWELVAVQQ